MTGSTRDTAGTKQMGIVALDGTPWDGPWMNRQQILSRLAEYMPIVYSNGLLYTWQRNQSGFELHPWFPRFEPRGALEIDVASRVLLRWRRFRALDRATVHRHAARLVRRVRARGAGSVTGYIFHPAFGEYARTDQFDRLVYHLYDSYEHTPEWNSVLAEAHADLIARADVVIASSPDVARYLSGKFGRGVETVTNGVDFQAFAAAELAEPGPLREIPRPRIGHVGRLNRKVDFALVADLAARRSDWQFVLIGPVANLDEPARNGIERCRELANVHFVGEQPRAELPAFTAHMDVNAMFYARRDDLWTDWAFPLKLHEYLAAGQPVVATDLPCLDEFRQVLAVASDPEQWLERLGEAVDGNGVADVQTRQSVARRNGWDAKLEHIREVLSRSTHAGTAGSGVP